MKLSFSTLGCPGWSWKEIYATAKDLGFDGIEIRGITDTVYAPECEPFLPDNIAHTVKRLADAKLSIPVLDTAAVLGVAESSEVSMMEARAYVDLAHKLGAPYIRVMPTPQAGPTPVDLELCATNYAALCDYAAPKGVSPLMETNGHFADSAVLADFLTTTNCSNAGALWDVHHPFRYFAETPEQTVRNLGEFIRHTHIKDSVRVNNSVQYRMMGYGDVPVKGAVESLYRTGYEGFLSLEWLKRWNPDLQEPGIVFAHYASFMNGILESIMQK